MAKRKITVTVDEEIIEEARRLGVDNLSAVVNEALAAHVERAARRAALRELLDTWEEKFGPPSEEDMAEARAAWDEADGITEGIGVR